MKVQEMVARVKGRTSRRESDTVPEDARKAADDLPQKARWKELRQRDRMVTRQCDCKCCMLVVERSDFGDEVFYDISIQDSRLDKNHNGPLGRMRRAVKALLGRPVYFNDLCIEGHDEYLRLVEELAALARDEVQDGNPDEGE